MNNPLFNENFDILVLEKCVIPELHIMQDFVNHLFWKSLVNFIGREKALIWPKKLNIVSKNYQGELFEGNHCRKLLKNAEKLLDPEIYQEKGYFSLIPYVSAFKTMDKIVNNCFSKKVNDRSELKKNIEELRLHLQGIETTETLKIHVLLCHLIQSLDYLSDYGLGVWSEQAGESVHREFLKFWERFKIVMIENDRYPEKLLKAVVEFSSRHI